MSETKKEMSEAEIAAKTGFGEPASVEEETTETEEETETTEETPEEEEKSDESEEEEADEKPAARQKREVAKDEDEEAEESEESDDESEEEESDEEDKPDESTKSKAKRTVPYSLLKSSKAKIRDLESQLQEARAAKEDDDGSDEEIEEAATKLGEELGLDKAGIKKILETSLKLSSKKSALPKDVQEKLKTIDELQAESKQSKEVAHFNKEWESLDIKKQYPNAPKAALKEAQELMDKLAHSKDHHKHELEYILFKNKAKFETILKTAAKQKSGEGAKRVGTEKSYESQESDEDLVDIEEMNPSIMKAREAKELEARRNPGKDKDYKIYNMNRED